MDSLGQPSAKLLYVIGEMSKKNMIDANEKAKLKEFVVNQDQGIYSLLSTYSNASRQEELMAALRQLVQPTQDKFEEAQSQELTNIQDNSPLDTKMMKRKRQQKQANIGEFRGLLNLNKPE